MSELQPITRTRRIAALIAALLALAATDATKAGERGPDCWGDTCYVEGTGGDVFAWVLKSGADWSNGKTMVTRKGKRCDSACAVTAAMMDGDGRLMADPKAVYCFCHTDKERLASLTDWWDTIPPRWLKRLKTGKPFYYREVRK